MVGLVLSLALSQGPGSTLEVTPLPGSTLPSSSQSPSELKLRPLEGNTGSSLQVRSLDGLIRKVALVEGREHPCEGFATQVLCDDPKVIGSRLANELLTLSDGGPTLVSHYRFIALKPGRTTCSCGQPRNLQYVYEFTVGSIEDAVRPVVRKVVGAAIERLYTTRRSLVP